MQFILKFAEPRSVHEILALNHKINRELGSVVSFKMPTAQQIFTQVEINMSACPRAAKRLRKIARIRKFTVADKI